MSSRSGTPHSSVLGPPDFTTGMYRRVLQLALENYAPRTFHSYSVDEKCFLMRHDVDLSLNRALALAQIEHDLGVSTTYLVDPHSMFYNLAEKRQAAILREILDLGHTLGLHFDASFRDVTSESRMVSVLEEQARWLEFLVGVRPSVMSFHNPSEDHLRWRADAYAGMVNCYSSQLMDSFTYISDSNGYWRFRQLQDVLLDATAERLQILIHPGWWQETKMSPRQRIFRSSFGRAAATMSEYDESLDRMARANIHGLPGGLERVRSAMGPRFTVLDYLWNEGHIASLFLELWRLHEMQLSRLCRARFRVQWRIPVFEVNALFSPGVVSLDGWRLFEIAFGETWETAIGNDPKDHEKWKTVLDQLIHGQETLEADELERGCTYLANIVTSLAAWGLQQSPQYDGLASYDSLDLPSVARSESCLVQEFDANAAMNNGKISTKHEGQWRYLTEQLLNGRTAPN